MLHLEKMNRIQRSKPQAPTTFSPAHALTWGQSCRLNVTLEIEILPPQKRDKLGSAFQEALRRTPDLRRGTDEREPGELGSGTVKETAVVSSRDGELVSPARSVGCGCGNPVLLEVL